MNLHLRNARVVDPLNNNDSEGDIYVSNGRIVSTSLRPMDFESPTVLDLKKLVVCPGLIDISVRLGQAGRTYRSTLEDELKAALAGGVTSIGCPPDLTPVLDEPGLVRMLKKKREITTVGKNISRWRTHKIS